MLKLAIIDLLACMFCFPNQTTWCSPGNSLGYHHEVCNGKTIKAKKVYCALCQFYCNKQEQAQFQPQSRGLSSFLPLEWKEEERSWEQGWHNSLPCRCCGLQVALSPHDVIQKIGKVTNNGFYNTIKERTCAYTRASPSYTTQFSHALQHIYVLETHSHREDIFRKHQFPTQQKVNKPV